MIFQNLLTAESVFWLAGSTRVSRVRCGVSPHRLAREHVRTFESAVTTTRFQASRLKQAARRGCHSIPFRLSGT